MIKPRRPAVQFVFYLLEVVAPFFVNALVRRDLRQPGVAEVNSAIAATQTQLEAAPFATDQVDALISSDTDQSTGLVAKAVAILTAVAIISAVLAGIQVALWSSMTPFQHGCMVVSDFYATIAFFELLSASGPQRTYVYTPNDLQSDLASLGGNAQLFKLRASAQRLAFISANRSSRQILSNTVQSSLESVRNSAISALFAALPYGLTAAMSWVTSVVYWCLAAIGK